jgi:hypothetical protein
MQATGQLRGLNAEYRQNRTTATATGQPYMSYGGHLERYKLRMLYEMARVAR